MKRKKCPYCGKRMSYISAFYSRRKAEYVCNRCGKESRVDIDRRVILVFILFAVLSVAIMLMWYFSGMISNPLGILFVIIPLILFALISPKFVRLAPLKKYKKSMEARKAGIAYSDNLTISELDEEQGASDFTGQFKINADIFNTIKSERNAARSRFSETGGMSNNIESSSEKTDSSVVHVIDDVREEHATSAAPLKKIHSEGARRSHYIQPNRAKPEDSGDDDVKEYKKSSSNKYSGNRKF